MHRDRTFSPWILAALAGAAAGGWVGVAELVGLTRPLALRDTLVAVALAALVSAVALATLSLPVAAWMRRNPTAAHEGMGERWAIGAAVVLALSLAGLGGIVHFGAGVRGGWRTVVPMYIAWCGLSAAGGWLAAARLAKGSRSVGGRSRAAARLSALLGAAVLVGAAVALARGGLPASAFGCALGGALLVGAAPRLGARWLVAASIALWLVAASARLVPGSPSRPERRAPPPGSIVFVVLDTTRADAFGSYGANSGDTPVFDALAAEGRLYEELISVSPWTIPSHATMFTGLPPRVHDCWMGGRRWLDEELETLAERLSTRGFETAAFFGNGHLPASNLLQGFAVREFLGSPASKTSLGWAMRTTGVGIAEWIDRGASRAVSEIERWLAGRDSNKPFFLFVNLFEAHDPYVSPVRFHRWPSGVGALEAIGVVRRFDVYDWFAAGRSDGREAAIVRAAHLAGVRYQDGRLGELLAALGERYDLDLLPIVLTTDHGENLGEAGRWGHQFALNDALIHLPLVIRAPSRVEAGGRMGGSFSSVDLAATLLDLAGMEAEFGLGRTLLAERAPEPATFAEVYPFYPFLPRLESDFATGVGDFRWPLSAVRSEGHKLVIWHGGPARLYDLTADPAEERDVLAERPELAARLLARYTAWSLAVPRLRRNVPDAEAAPLDPELAEQLRALGYL